MMLHVGVDSEVVSSSSTSPVVYAVFVSVVSHVITPVVSHVIVSTVFVPSDKTTVAAASDLHPTAVIVEAALKPAYKNTLSSAATRFSIVLHIGGCSWSCTKAVVAICVESVDAAAVGAVGVPESAGDANGAVREP